MGNFVVHGLMTTIAGVAAGAWHDGIDINSGTTQRLDNGCDLLQSKRFCRFCEAALF
jgi:hypothetical protein